MSANLLKKYQKNVKYTKIRSLPKLSSRVTVCPYEEKAYWKEVLDIFEKRFENVTKKRTKFYNFSTTLPPNLHERVAKLVPITTLEEEKFDDIENISPIESTEEKEEQSTSRSEGTKQISTVETKITKSLIKGNWLANYRDLGRKERVKWNTKLYDMEKDKMYRPLIEHAEDLMDVAAERFANFFNSIGSDQSTDITKEMVKSLFVIDLKDKKNDNDEQKELDIQRKISKMILQNPEFIEFQKMKKRSIKTKYIPKSAFGRTLPRKNEDFLPRTTSDTYEPYFPEELRTGEIIFSGICNLKVTKDLIKYFMENKELKRPEYLTKIRCFSEVESGAGKKRRKFIRRPTIQ